jgi:hypothetical protein
VLGNLKKRTLERSRLTWENNIKMDLKEIESVGVDCSVLVMELTTEYNTHQKVGW